MSHSILLFPYLGDIFPYYSLKDGKITDIIEWLLALINDDELDSELRNHSHPSPLFPFTGQFNIIIL